MIFLEIKSLPVVVIDDFYSKQEHDLIWQELCFYHTDPNNFVGPEKTGSAENKDGEVLKKNKGIFLDEVYHLKNFSSILKINRKIFNRELCQTLIEKHTFFNYLKESNKDSTLIQYYENSDYYKSHWDKSLITVISWFFEEPKSFTGGDLIFDDGTLVSCKNNRLIMFPSILNHEVSEIFMDTNLLGKNLGRYSISQFVSINLGRNYEKIIIDYGN